MSAESPRALDFAEIAIEPPEAIRRRARRSFLAQAAFSALGLLLHLLVMWLYGWLTPPPPETLDLVQDVGLRRVFLPPAPPLRGTEVAEPSTTPRPTPQPTPSPTPQPTPEPVDERAPAQPRGVELDCADGVDNDADGATDCADSNCAADPACLIEASPSATPAPSVTPAAEPTQDLTADDAGGDPDGLSAAEGGDPDGRAGGVPGGHGDSSGTGPPGEGEPGEGDQEIDLGADGLGRIPVLHRPAARELRYPPLARREGIEGDVVIEILIDVDGSVLEVQALSGPSMFHNAALEHARKYRFGAYVSSSGRPTRARFRLQTRFRLR